LTFPIFCYEKNRELLFSLVLLPFFFVFPPLVNSCFRPRSALIKPASVASKNLSKLTIITPYIEESATDQMQGFYEAVFQNPLLSRLIDKIEKKKKKRVLC